MINSDFSTDMQDEADHRGINKDEAWDDVEYVDLEVDDDFFQKCLAIKEGEDYDTRVSIPVDFSDEELLKYARMAHEQDITLNQFIENALRSAIDEHRRDPEGARARADRWKETQL
jgi:hypothetical protein